MVKRKSSRKKAPVAEESIVAECLSCGDGRHEVSWAKVGATLGLGIIFGMYFANTALDINSIMQFIAIILIVLCLILLVDIRRHLDY